MKLGTILKSTRTKRIAGGSDAFEGQAPYQCALEKYESIFCGCAILSDRWIITAGHCLNRFVKQRS